MSGKQLSIVTIAKQGDGYSLNARGAFGGGFTRHVSADELNSAIIRAWQMYGNNPLGFAVIGDLPEEIRDTVDKLVNSTGGDSVGFNLRLSRVELDILRAKAESEGVSLQKWIKAKLFM